MNIFVDERIVMTLDAGGTNFVFSAMQRGEEIVEPLVCNSNAHDLDLCLLTLTEGFKKVKEKLPAPPVAISFAFPGPADYKSGIIGKLPNLPAFSGEGVPLGPMLEDQFNLPVYIANDGNLFAFGEAVAGALPFVNRKLKELKIARRYSNLLGVTLGTGFGAGVVINNTLCEGDNSAGGEIWLSRNFKDPAMFSEGSISIRGIQMAYAEAAQESNTTLSPKDIYEIACGKKEGNRLAAQQAFDRMAIVLAEALCNAITLIDGIIVIGGGMAEAYSLLAPKIIEHMGGTILNMDRKPIPRLVSQVYDLEQEDALQAFLSGGGKQIKVPFSDRTVFYSHEKKIGFCKSKLGTSQAIALGAYALALDKLSATNTVRKDLIGIL